MMDTQQKRKIKLLIKPKIEHKFTFVDLFCGIGGFHLAMKQLGGKCVFASDIDQKCRDIYQLNHGMVPAGDITQQLSIPRHDILCGGFPCQSYSNAGKKLAFNDKRGLLFDNIVNILSANHTPFAILENVKHIKKVSDGLVYKYIYDQLHKIGYQVFDLGLSPNDINVPQNRERIIFVVIRNDLYTDNKKEEFLSKLGVNIAKYRDKNENRVIYESDPDPKYNISNETAQLLEVWDEFIKICARIGEIVSPAITEYFKGEELPENSDWKNGYIRKNRSFYQKYKAVIDPWYEKNHELLSKKAVYGKLEWQTGGIRPDDTIYKYFIQIRQSGIRVKKTDCFPALVAVVQTSIIASKGRYLTPRECARLQSVPDDFSFGNQSDKIVYKQLGNGVNSDIIKVVAETLLGVYPPPFG